MILMLRGEEAVCSEGPAHFCGMLLVENPVCKGVRTPSTNQHTGPIEQVEGVSLPLLLLTLLFDMTHSWIGSLCRLWTWA